MSLYEYHRLNNDLPIILHLDTLKKDGFCRSISNWHENIELLYCIEGKGHTVIDSNSVKMEEGTVTVINSGMIHYTTADSDILKYYCLIIDATFLQKLGLDVERTCLSEHIADNRLREYFNAIVTEHSDKKDFYENMVKGSVISLMSYIFRFYSLGENQGRTNNAVKSSIKYIHEHFKEDISVSNIAEHVGYSRFHFSRKFTESVGFSVKEYIQILRCREAEDMLRTHKYTVSEVATECGFSDVSYFTKTFKRVFGYLPSKLKR